ncbi:YciI family protein [soil metagenome]
MFIVILTYIKPLDIVDQHVTEHRAFLEQGYQQNCFIASGPQNPRVGGILISQLSDRQQLEQLLKNDPYQIHGIAEYQIIEFNPVKYHKDFAGFIENMGIDIS